MFRTFISQLVFSKYPVVNAARQSSTMAIAAVGQICSTSSMTHNLSQCKTVFEKAANQGAQALFLPEASDYIGSSPAETVSLCQPVSTSPFVLGIQALCREHALACNVGIHEPGSGADSEKKVKNTSIWVDDKGEIVQRYQKLHLFDVEIEGGPVLKESNSVEKGMEILPPFETAVGRVGLLICFDLRFPEPSLALKRLDSQIITYPSAFTVPTGQAHWETILRCRAIETQAYVIAAAQVGNHNEKRVSYGHSLVVDPWGKVVAELSGSEDFKAKGESWEPECVAVEIDLNMRDRIKREMPLLRRTDVYPEI